MFSFETDSMIFSVQSSHFQISLNIAFVVVFLLTYDLSHYNNAEASNRNYY